MILVGYKKGTFMVGSAGVDTSQGRAIISSRPPPEGLNVYDGDENDQEI
jgi:hypothetical protein